jgi:hypothetical protein
MSSPSQSAEFAIPSFIALVMTLHDGKRTTFISF